MLTMAYTAELKFISDPPSYVQEVLIPSLDGSVRCNGDTCKFPFANELYWWNALFILLGAIVLLLLGLFLAALFAFPFGPFLRARRFFRNLYDCLCCKFQTGTSNEDSKGSNENEELIEISEERRAVNEIFQPFLVSELKDGTISIDASNIQRDSIAPILTKNLRKVYPSKPPKVGLIDLDIHVSKGEVLGLLGKNGSGKTTLVKILASGHEASGGIGLVAGYNCATEKISIFERLGNCAQFDVVWKGRTVQHHLEFFARLKGLPKENYKQTARLIAKAVGLGSEEVYGRRKASQLSGGMRRRLSIAMSLIGSPEVLVLDEPSTGLDAATRNGIWELVHSFATKRRCLIFTTHSMLEADTLATKIAILAQGRLKVIGTQQHLKDNFGSGYSLQINLVKSNTAIQDDALAFVRKYIHPEAVLASKQAKTLHINLPRDLDLGKVFGALYSDARTTEGHINQFILSQASLEDVFLSLG